MPPTALYANGVKIKPLKAKDSEIKPYPLCSRNTLTSITRKNELNGKVYHFSVSYETIDVSDIEEIHKCLMKNTIFCKCLDSLSKCLLL